MERRVFDVSWTTLWRILFFLVLVTLMFSGRQVLLGLFLAIVISSGLEFIVDFLERWRIPRPLGVIFVFLAGALLFIVTVYAVIPLILIDLNNFVANLSKLGASPWWAPFLNFKAAKSFDAVVNRISTMFLSGNSSPLGAFSNVLGGIVLAVSVLISSFYLSLSRDGVERFIKAVVPEEYEESMLRVYERVRRKIGSWFRSQLLLSVLMAVLVMVTLLALKVKYAFLLGLLAGVFELVPFVGPILSGSAATVAAFGTSPATAFYTIIAFVVLHQVESHILVPLLIGKSVGLHPVIVIIALLIGVQAGGVLGALVSVPAAAVIQEILEDWAGRRKPKEVALG